MILILLVFLGGVLTILSPCVLPVLPFVFARAEQPFLKNGLPMLVGMALTFAGVATLAAVGGAWAVQINQYGRVFALVLLTFFALTLLSRRMADVLARPFVALGNKLLAPSSPNAHGGLTHSLLLGVATGLLWAPCAGPILGLVLTGAAISGPNTQTTLLLFTYAAGATTSLAIAILAGNRVFATMKKSLGAGEWVRRGLGIAVLLAVATIASGLDTAVLTKLSLTSTNRLEQSLIERIQSSGTGHDQQAKMSSISFGNMGIEGLLPSLDGAGPWLNSPPLTPEALRGKVVLVDFWTYSCINCLRSLPYIKAWNEKYQSHGLVIIAVHAPEFAFERDESNVRKAVKDLAIRYPVVLDNKYAIWQRFKNKYWPAHYFIDSKGQIRGHHFGEGSYRQSEQFIRQLLTEAGYQDLPSPLTTAMASSGVQAAADRNRTSAETYLGYGRAQHFTSPGGFAKDQSKAYRLPAKLDLHEWGLEGDWRVYKQQAISEQPAGKISYRFNARDLHLVLAPALDGKPVRFRVQVDGKAPGDSHGLDIDEHGYGVIKEQRLYQLLRMSNGVGEHSFLIEFLDRGAQAFAFTFG